MIDHRVLRYEELKEERNKQQKDSNDKGMDITSNLYRLHNAVLIGRLVEVVDEIKALKDEMKELQEHHQVQLKKLTESNVRALNEKEKSAKEHL